MIVDDIDFAIVMAVHESWTSIQRIPNYAEVAGEILFRKIFELAPGAINMYSFGPEFVGNEESLYSSDKFKAHARGVVAMLDAAVNMLGPDLEPVLIELGKLGARHVEYGVLPAHYGIVGEALLYTLETALGDKWTPRVLNGWTMIYGMVSTAMMTGAERRVAQRERRVERMRQKMNSPVSPKKKAAVADSSLVERRKTRGSRKSVSTVLSEITGIRGFAKKCPDNSRQEKVSKMIDDALSVVSMNSSTMGSGSTCDVSDPALDPSSYGDTIECVYQSWDKVRAIPNYQEVAGVLLFRKIFEIAPGAKALFRFTDNYSEGDDALYNDQDFLAHARRVVNMLDVAVNMLGPDLDPVTRALRELGEKHVAYGVITDHYPIVGQALLSTLETALGDGWTPKVKDGWATIYGFVSTTMIAGAKAKEEKTRRRKASKAAGSSSSSVGSSSSTVDSSSSHQGQPQATTEQFSYAGTIELVYQSWDKVRSIPSYQEVAGVLLFRKIFEIAPGAKALFRFTDNYSEGDDALYNDPDFLTHARGVVNMLDVAVNMLGPDLEPVTYALKELGAKHVAYGVIPDHYPIVGQALLSTLETALGDGWTPKVKDGWTAIYGFVSTTMIAGAKAKEEKPRSKRGGLVAPAVSSTRQ